MIIMQVDVILAQTKIFIWTFEAMAITQRLCYHFHRHP